MKHFAFLGKMTAWLTMACLVGVMEIALFPVALPAGVAGPVLQASGQSQETGFVVKERTSPNARKKPNSLLPWIIGGGIVLAVLLVVLLKKGKDQGEVTVTEFGGHGSTDGLLDDPSGIALDGDGNVYVSDRGNRRIQKFTANGKFIKKWGFAPGNTPYGLVVHGGRLYVCDAFGASLQSFDLEGNHLGSWPVPDFNNRTGAPAPVDVDADSSGDLYVLDNINRVVVVFNGAGTVKGHFAVDRDNPWPGPNGIAVAGSQVFVAESSDNQYGNRINVFSRDGAFVRTWGGSGSGAGQFRNPIGIALMGGSSLIVGDINAAPTFARIQKFDLSGGFQGMIQPAGGAFYARALAVNDRAGKIYICAGDTDIILVADTF